MPELRYFRTHERRSAIQVGVALLDEVLTLLECGAVERISPAVVRTLRAAIDDFIRTSDQSGGDESVPPLPALDALRNTGIETVDERTYRERADRYAERRRALVCILNENGWSWDDII